MKKSTFNRLLSIFLMVMAVIFGVNGQVIMAEAALPDGGTTEGGHASEAGGATAAQEAGNGGAGRQSEGIASETQGRENFNEKGTEFYENDINDKITKIRPMATPVDQISRYATTKSASSFVVEYWSIGTRPIKTTVKETTVESTGTSMVLKVEDPEMFTLDDTIRVVGVKAITNYKNQAYTSLTDEPTPDLELCVCGKDNEGYPIVYAVNGKLVNKQPIGIPVLQKGQKLIRDQDLTNALVCADALHGQQDTARAILDANGNYLLQIKENQKTILRNAENVAKAREPNGVKKK